MKILKQFDKETVVNAILYVTNSVGGQIDLHKLFKILYFADREHLSKYGRRITGDVYIAMDYGPVPSKIDDIMKAVRGDSFFAGQVDYFKQYFFFVNKKLIAANTKADMDFLSASDVECLDVAIGKCKDLSFAKLTEMSHDYAWNNTNRNRKMSFADIMREMNEEEGYATYIQQQLEMENSYC